MLVAMDNYKTPGERWEILHLPSQQLIRAKFHVIPLR
jgi:hypothetical protein